MTDYIDALTYIISKTTDSVSFDSPKLDYDQFSIIVKASRHCNTLSFNKLKLTSNGIIDFGSYMKYNIKKFSLMNSGLEEYGNWGQDRSEFDLI